MESFFHTLKVELIHQCRWASHAEARQALFGYIEGNYTRYRMHSALGYLTPEQAEENMTANPRCPRNRGKINSHERVCAVVLGGNLDPAQLAEIVESSGSVG